MTNASSTEPASDRVLVVFDFDWSLINEDSDLFVFKELHPELLREMLASRDADAPWIPFMDDLFRQLAADKPHVGERGIREALARVPIHPRMLDAIKLAGSQPNAVVVIVSGGNTVLIESVLEHHQLMPYVHQVVANPAMFEHPERLRVRPYHDAATPHGCSLCPPNMCKGVILDQIRRDNASDRILYVGDGTGDYCPATRMSR
jgi:pyridoxal phosphate phosphatase PHOSPHO2